MTRRRATSTGRNTRNRPTDTALLDAACGVIADVGVGRATMDMIAQAADTTRVTLYAHFGSREALVDAVIDRELQALTNWMVEVYDNSATMRFGARARYSIELLFEYARRNPDGLRVLLGNRYHDDNPARRLSATLEPIIADRLRANYAESGARIGQSADTLASLLLGLSLDIIYRAVIVGRCDLDAACDLAVTASLAVLRAVRVDQLQAIDGAP